MMICNECETVAHCSKHGCVPKRDFWEGYVFEPVKPAQQEFVSPGGGYVPAIPAQQRPIKTFHGGKAWPVQEPAQRTWVGLTDEERRSIREWQRIQEELGPVWSPMMLYLYEAIEAKLKEKNT